MARYYKTQKLPSIELSEDLLRKVTQVLEIEYEKLHEDKKDSLFPYDSKAYTLTKKDNSVFETDDSQKFLESDFDRDVTEITLRVHTQNKDIDVKITTNSWSDSSFNATSRDSDDVWVNGIMTKLAQIFDVSRNSHQFWHSKRAYLIYIPIALAIATLVTYFSSSLSPKISVQFLAIMWVLYSVTYPFSMAMLFQWMFPKVETKKSKQRKVKKIILSMVGIVGTIILSIIGSYIYDIIK